MSRASMVVIALLWIAIAVWSSVRDEDPAWVVGSLVIANMYVIGAAAIRHLERP